MNEKPLAPEALVAKIRQICDSVSRTADETDNPGVYRALVLAEMHLHMALWVLGCGDSLLPPHWSP